MPQHNGANTTPITVRAVPIELNQFLKVANVVMSGGEAKSLIQSGVVKVNGVVETRRSKQLVNGDVVEIDEELSLQVDANAR